MINQLYTFTVGTYVVTEEWNANFDAINKSNIECANAIKDAEAELAFPDSDLTQLFNSVRKKPNSFAIAGSTVIVQPECEYYKALADGEDLAIEIPVGLNAESRIAIKISDNRRLLPFSVSYKGEELIVNHYDNYVFRAGYYFILIYETNSLAQVKLIWTGV